MVRTPVPTRLAAAGPARLGGMAAALALGTLGGAIAAGVGLPLPWMLGPMVACAVAALAGARLSAPTALRPVVIPVIGVLLGAAFSPDLLAQIPAWAGTFLLLPVFLAVGGGAAWAFYVRLGGYDARTAFFCAMPGGINEMVLIGAEAGADERRIALAHGVRIFTVISVVALTFAAFGGTSTAGLPRERIGLSDLPLGEAGLLTLCAVAGPWLAARARLPAPGLFGPMLLSAAAHLGGIAASQPPDLLVAAAQVVIGTVLGCRFVGARLSETGRDMALGVAASLVLLAVTLVFGVLVGRVTAAPWSQAVLAYAPGGLTEMSLLALAKGQDVAYVATAHVARIVIVLFAVRPLFALLRVRLPGRSGTDAEPP